MKKVISLVLAMSMLVVVMAPTAGAANISVGEITEEINLLVDSFEEVDANGNVMRFELKEKIGGYELNYYLNDVLTTTYAIGEGQSTITATRKADAVGTTYTLQVADPVVREVADLFGKDRWVHEGYIQYGYSSTFDCEPWGVISSKDTDSFNGTYTVNTYENSSYSDWIAVITSVLIGAGMATLAPATFAAGVLAGMIGYYGSEVINDVISIPFIEEYECSSITYTLRARVMGSGMGETDVVDYEGGVVYCIKYTDAPAEYVDEGWTPRNWACREFGRKVWADAVPFWPTCPTIVGFPAYM